MLFKTNIWLVFYALVCAGCLYLGYSVTSAWWGIQQRTLGELATVNKIFASSVQTSFDQQEIVLDLLGTELLDENAFEDQDRASQLLDRLLVKNRALVGFGLFDLSGKMIAASSSVDIKRMPNLRTHEKSRETFERAIAQRDMVLGDTYFLPAVKSWIIPFRKGIRDQDDRVIGVMTTGIKPSNLVPRLSTHNEGSLTGSIPLMLIHDENFRYAYISAATDDASLVHIINSPVPESVIASHREAIFATSGMTLEELKSAGHSLEYVADTIEATDQHFSLAYIPKYQLWSLAVLPRKALIKQLISQSVHYVLAFVIAVIVLFFLIRHIHGFESRRHQQLLNLANHDFLTGLNNRLYLKSAESLWIDKESRFSILFIDLDHFKNINDSYGHSFGDKILQEIARRLLNIGLGFNLICRQGGDEFIILSRHTGERELTRMATEIVEQISKPIEVEQFDFTIGASIGICLYPEDGDSFDSLFSAADTAMYQAKRKKLDYFIFTEELRRLTRSRHRIEQALHNAVKNEELYLLYQPQIQHDGSLYGVEALVRWNSAELGQIPPCDFIPIAEDSGSIIELGRFILDQAIRDIAECNKHYAELGIRLSINISVRQFLEKGFIAQLTQALERHRFPQKQLTLEITESIFIDDFEYILPIFDQVRSQGIKISLDDFGTGYSSLSMLRRLPIDELKIDKSFIDQITSDTQARALVVNILDIADHMGLKVVAEGIEEQAQCELLSSHKNLALQGYLFSKPLRFEALSAHCDTLKTGPASGFQKPC